MISFQVANAAGRIKVEVNDGNERMQKKVRMAELEKIPHILVVGNAEADTGTVNLCRRGAHKQELIDLDSYIERLKIEVETRSLD